MSTQVDPKRYLVTSIFLLKNLSTPTRALGMCPTSCLLSTKKSAQGGFYQMDFDSVFVNRLAIGLKYLVSILEEDYVNIIHTRNDLR